MVRWIGKLLARHREDERWLRHLAQSNNAASRLALLRLAEDIRPYGYKIADWIMKPIARRDSDGGP